MTDKSVKTSRKLTRWGLAGAAVFALAGAQLAIATPAQAVPGLVRVVTTSALSSLNKVQVAACPAGTAVIGGGGFITGGFGQVGIDGLAPLLTGTGFVATAREDANGFVGNWTLSAIALCAPPPPGLIYVTATTLPSSINKSVAVSCPVGKSALGIGGQINNGLGQVILNDLRPSANLSHATVTGFETQGGSVLNWSVTVFAVCVNTPAGIQRVVATSAANSLTAKAITATCPAGKQVHGAGGQINGGFGQVFLDDVSIPLLTSVTVNAIEDETGFVGNWSVTAYAICAN